MLRVAADRVAKEPRSKPCEICYQHELTVELRLSVAVFIDFCDTLEVYIESDRSLKHLGARERRVKRVPAAVRVAVCYV